MTDNNLFHDLCRHHPHKECDLCEACMEEVYNLKYSYSEDYEPSDGEMEAWIDEQILADELKLDQL